MSKPKSVTIPIAVTVPESFTKPFTFTIPFSVGIADAKSVRIAVTVNPPASNPHAIKFTPA